MRFVLRAADGDYKERGDCMAKREKQAEAAINDRYGGEYKPHCTLAGRDQLHYTMLHCGLVNQEDCPKIASCEVYKSENVQKLPVRKKKK